MRNITLKSLLPLLFVVIATGCSVLPKTLNENNLIVAANYKWIGKIGKTTLSEGPAQPILKNIFTGKKYYPKYHNKSFTYFYDLSKGDYIVDEIVLNAGRVQFHMKLKEKANPFKIDQSGVYYIGGIDIVDYQTKFEFRLHDEQQVQNDVAIVRDLLSTKTSFQQSPKIIIIENVLNREKWERK